MIMEALLDGGWTNKDEEAAKNKTDDPESENPLVNSILKSNDDNEIVKSALNSQNVSRSVLFFKF